MGFVSDGRCRSWLEGVRCRGRGEGKREKEDEEREDKSQQRIPASSRGERHIYTYIYIYALPFSTYHIHPHSRLRAQQSDGERGRGTTRRELQAIKREPSNPRAAICRVLIPEMGLSGRNDEVAEGRERERVWPGLAVGGTEGLGCTGGGASPRDAHIKRKPAIKRQTEQKETPHEIHRTDQGDLDLLTTRVTSRVNLDETWPPGLLLGSTFTLSGSLPRQPSTHIWQGRKR